MKFTYVGSVRIFVEFVEDFVEVRIVDSGIGVPPEDRRKLFQLFGLVEGIQD